MGMYQDIFQVAIASLCKYRWNWEDCCSSRVSQDFEVVKQNVLNAWTRGPGAVSGPEEPFLSFHETRFTSASWRLTEDTVYRAFCRKSGLCKRMTNSHYNPTMLTAKQHFFTGLVTALTWVIMKCPRFVSRICLILIQRKLSREIVLHLFSHSKSLNKWR